jgi:pilus assembly protein CpaB
MSVPALKRNLVPLLCIALVAASAATGIFYGLLGSKLRAVSSSAPRQPIVIAARAVDRGAIVTPADLKLSSWGGAEPPKGTYSAIAQVAGKTVYIPLQENEPVTEARLVSQNGSAGLGIRSGMRAISVHASDSTGVLGLLRPGHRVDVQVVADRRAGRLKLRTLLENVEVLATPAAEPNGSRAAAPAVTLLATPEDADRLGLADAGARIRLLLRNPLDQAENARAALTMANLFADPEARRKPRAEAHVVHARGGQAENRGPIQFLVELAAARPGAVEELAAGSHWSGQARTLQVVSFPGGGSGRILRTLEEGHRIEILSSTRLSAGNRRRVSFQAGAGWDAQPDSAPGGACGLRIQFVPVIGPHGTLRIRVQPEITATRSLGIASRKIETEIEIEEGQGLLIAGISPILAERLFEGRLAGNENRELVVLVTVEVRKPARTAALASRR